MTQVELSERVRLSRACLSHYENGRREPDLAALTKLADFFGVTVDYLVGRTDKRAPLQPDSTMDPIDLGNSASRLSVDGVELTWAERDRLLAGIRMERRRVSRS
ncbi:HTH-type transcriptional regulator Xre [compost metagenome]